MVNKRAYSILGSLILLSNIIGIFVALIMEKGDSINIERGLTGERKLTSKQMLQKLLDDHYAGALAAKERGELIAWSTSIAPQEFCETMGIYTVYPENHAAAIGAKKDLLS